MQQTLLLDECLIEALEEIRAGQSLNLAYWASNILEAGRISTNDLERLFNLGF
jgi:hypothetical protein